MKSIDVVRAWKDARYRHSLSPSEHPVGEMILTENDLSKVMGGDRGHHHGEFRHDRDDRHFRRDRDDFRHDRDRFCRGCW